MGSPKLGDGVSTLSGVSNLVFLVCVCGAVG